MGGVASGCHCCLFVKMGVSVVLKSATAHDELGMVSLVHGGANMGGVLLPLNPLY